MPRMYPATPTHLSILRAVWPHCHAPPGNSTSKLDIQGPTSNGPSGCDLSQDRERFRQHHQRSCGVKRTRREITNELVINASPAGSSWVSCSGGKASLYVVLAAVTTLWAPRPVNNRNMFQNQLLGHPSAFYTLRWKCIMPDSAQVGSLTQDRRDFFGAAKTSDRANAFVLWGTDIDGLIVSAV